MPELRDQHTPSSSTVDHPSHAPHGYHITRKGSRYNITGPEGRIFTKYKSASTAGPRWEELTHTPWPYPSSAYEPGLRLWELGIITREEISNTRPVSAPAKPMPKAASGEAAKQPRKRKAPQAKTTVAKAPAAAPKAVTPAKVVAPVTTPKPAATPTAAVSQAHPMPAPARIDITPSLLALPAPKIDLARQTQIITALRKEPRLLFKPEVRIALKHEVEYHRPYAAWAQNLLKMLARYDARQRSHVKVAPIKQETILARHIAWQEHQFQLKQVAVNH